jgi:hypothetical protein
MLTKKNNNYKGFIIKVVFSVKKKKEFKNEFKFHCFGLPNLCIIEFCFTWKFNNNFNL